MLFLLCVYMLVKAAVDALPEGPPVPAGVKIRYAGTADIRQLSRSDRGHRVLSNVELPYVLIVRLTSGRYVVLVSPDAILPVPRIMVLSGSTVYIVSELELTVRWAHSTGDTLNWFEARIPGPWIEPFEEFAGCFLMNYEFAPRDTGVDDGTDAYEITHVYNRFEGCYSRSDVARESFPLHIRATCIWSHRPDFWTRIRRHPSQRHSAHWAEKCCRALQYCTDERRSRGSSWRSTWGMKEIGNLNLYYQHLQHFIEHAVNQVEYSLMTQAEHNTTSYIVRGQSYVGEMELPRGRRGTSCGIATVIQQQLDE
ncbi:uncharacterized protein B0H18DRAFT_954122 [Fomitopsis serialis]|uniref:uncharacterized protein n=1 Tax=Fomitopsis serialis TaxID=139415 RepID=UPI0020081EE1|nr:uncharacterized protein B0H18DRAFT_954122 [Neoantrodia serialis]KAH9928132.1 hypothetical protein B0H18DRAFT_954122 [Neoantrodia serialis]